MEISKLKTLSEDFNYKEWFKKEKGKKDRLIEEPLPELSAVLSKLHCVLRKVETPEYLFSGKRFTSAHHNAEYHKEKKYMITVDIEKFYQSTKREYVYTMFRDTFEQYNDIASLLANVVTYQGHIPTGTATSQLIAFWAYKKTFDRIYKLCRQKNITMSVWVDDITFSSSQPIPERWVKDIKAIMSEVHLSLKANKIKKYSANDYKVVTGTAISPSGGLKVKNQKRAEILALIEGRRVEDLDLKETRSLFGKLNAQRQNEGGFFQNVYERSKKRLVKLEKRNRARKKRMESPVEVVVIEEE